MKVTMRASTATAISQSDGACIRLRNVSQLSLTMLLISSPPTPSAKVLINISFTMLLDPLVGINKHDEQQEPCHTAVEDIPPPQLSVRMSRPISARVCRAAPGNIAGPTAFDAGHWRKSLDLLAALKCYRCFAVEAVGREVRCEISAVDAVLAVLIGDGIV